MPRCAHRLALGLSQLSTLTHQEQELGSPEQSHGPELRVINVLGEPRDDLCVEMKYLPFCLSMERVNLKTIFKYGFRPAFFPELLPDACSQHLKVLERGGLSRGSTWPLHGLSAKWGSRHPMVGAS